MYRSTLLLLVLLFVACATSQPTSSIFFVNSNGKDTYNVPCGQSNLCGTSLNPFSSIKEAIDAFVSGHSVSYEESVAMEIESYAFPSSPSLTLYLSPGVYSGSTNKNIQLNNQFVQIVSLGNEQNTFIDCQGVSNAFTVVNSATFSIDGVTFVNCSGINGGAIQVTDSNSMLRNVRFFNNVAHNGAAIYANGGSLICEQCFFQNNIAFENGGAIYADVGSVITLTNVYAICNSPISKTVDFYLKSSDIFYDGATNVSAAGIRCEDGSSFVPSGLSNGNLCNQNRKCSVPLPLPSNALPNYSTSNQPTITPVACNSNNVCEPNLGEDCTSCSDCPSCTFTGSKLEIYGNCQPGNYSASCLVSVEALTQFGFDLLKPLVFPMYGRMVGYIDIAKDDIYVLHVASTNLGVKLSMNDQLLINSYFESKKVDTTYTTKIVGGNKNYLSLEFISYNNQLKSVELEIRATSSASQEFTKVSTVFSQNVCGDDILDELEKNSTSIYYCPLDSNSIQRDVATCGDGICNEVPTECLRDCYKFLGSNCPSQVEPIRLSSTYQVNDFTSQLLNNQYLTSLPGLVHLAHGVDLLTHEELPYQMFDFGYCDNTSYSVIQDNYRAAVYNVPPEFYAEAHPICSYDTSSKTYSSASEYTTEISNESGLSASASAGGGFAGIQVSVSASYSQSTAAKSASELKQSAKNSITSTKVKCFSSKVSRNAIKFSENFVLDISTVKNATEMMNFIKLYGVLYYKSATLGGQLEQLSVTSKSTTASMSSSELKQNQAMSFSLSVSSPFASASASYSRSVDTETSQESREEYESSTERSSILTKGGAPGSFGPSGDAPSSFGDWAQTVDLNPVPIESQLDFVGTIIPKSWKSYNGSILRDLWFQGLELYLEEYLNTKIDTTDEYTVEVYLSASDIVGTFLNISATIKDNKPVQNIDKIDNQLIVIDNSTRIITFSIPHYNTENLDSLRIVVHSNGQDTYLPPSLIQYIIVTESSYGRGYYLTPAPSSSYDFVPNYFYGSNFVFMSIDVDPRISQNFTALGLNYNYPVISLHFEALNGSLSLEFPLSASTENTTIFSRKIDNSFLGPFKNVSVKLSFDTPSTGSLFYNLYNDSIQYISPPNIFVLQTCGDPEFQSTDPYYTHCVPRSKFGNDQPGYANNYRSIGEPVDTSLVSDELQSSTIVPVPRFPDLDRYGFTTQTGSLLSL